MKEIMDFFDSGCIPNNTIRRWLRKTGQVPWRVPITSTDIYNFRTRAILYTCRENRWLKDDAAQKLLMCQSLDKQEESEFGQIEGLASKCYDILKDVMSDNTVSSRLENYLIQLQEVEDSFQFEIGRDRLGHPIGVVWMTHAMRQSWIRYGDLMFLDAKKRIK